MMDQNGYEIDELRGVDPQWVASQAGRAEQLANDQVCGRSRE